jgi:hypothetical protein
MMQAAQLAAEAAMREAAAAAAEDERNANSGGGEGGKVQMPNLSMMDMMHESSGSFMQDPSEEMMTRMESMQGLQEDYDYPGDMAYEQEQYYDDEQQYYQEDQQYYHEQQQGQVQHGGGEDYNQMLLQEMQMMGIDPNDPEGVQFFLQYIQQREEQERQQAERPDEHYMTIAQNGR